MGSLVTYGQTMIDHEGPVPIYQQLAAILRDRIRNGELPPNRAVPSVARLQQEYGIARGTVLHTLKVLSDEGLIYAVPGRGMFVAER